MAVSFSKVCSTCLVEKDPAEFRAESSGRVHAQCRDCENARGRERRKARGGVDTHSRPTAPEPAARVQAPPPPPLPPLIEAVQEHEARRGAAKLKSHNSALIEENSRLRAILDEVRLMEEPSTPLLINRPPEPEKGEAVPFVLFSDWHVEEEVSLEQMHGVNQFNLEIARQRSSLAFTNALRLIAMLSKESLIRRVVCQLGGDFFSNSIHPELMEINQLRPGDAAHFAKSILEAGIRYWLANSDLSFHFVCVGGNHGRMTEKTRISTGSGNSLEIFMYRFLSEAFKGEPRVKFDIAAGNMLYHDIVPGYRLRAIHGDQVKYGGGVGGLTIPLNKWVMRQDQSVRADLTALGHFHQMLDGGNWLVNGSLIGATPYAQWFGFSPEAPAQQMCLIHSRNGGTKSVVAPIWVTE